MSCFETLKERHLKLTPQRRAIIEILHANDRHITAEEMIALVQARMPGVNKSTIYRTLDLLGAAGCVYKSEMDNQFVYHHADESHHHHLVCSHCGRTIECSESMFAGVKKSIEDRYGFSVDLHHLVIEGLCRNCRTNVDSPKEN